ncbi:MAG: DNA polymerase III subunit gamma/tau, partial [Pseudomonadota bacterium]|nr:DNA polymerase III subunit gamma/tau [Pseudomonadota bacterium]
MNDITKEAPPRTADEPYRVLARKYRPAGFDELIGQDTLVRTLTNAIRMNRIAHAFMLTGVRGVGKTTTARIVAKALNCTGTDGNGGPTPTPCGVCDQCVAIARDRHVDVMEMDAASRTGVDDVRELVDSVRYGPVSARYKVFIIDEVHMLTKNAFNALLKTLEEPPEHTIFIFATTEVRKVPVTVLSRCQRFDLRRVDKDVLTAHYSKIAKLEAIDMDDAALALIARAADGSVRDGLSLLDQAASLGEGRVTEAIVTDMLGLADRGKVLDLLEAALTGKSAKALDILSNLHDVGAAPAAVTQDLLELVHILTRLKLVPETAQSANLPEAERTRGVTLSDNLSMTELVRAWQLLLKGMGEILSAPIPDQALEMVIIRLLHSSDLPAPVDLIRQLKDSGPPGTGLTAPSGGGSGARAMIAGEAPLSRAATVTAPQPASERAPMAFADLAELFAQKGEMIIYGHLHHSVHLVRLAQGVLEFRAAPDAPSDLAGRIGARLREWTGDRWLVSLSREEGAPTLEEQERTKTSRQISEAERHPVV